MNLKVKYTPVLVRESESVRDFLVEAMGFKFFQKISITGEQSGIVIGRSNTDESFLFLVEDPTMRTTLNSQSNIIINTDDCLTDYHKLVDLGMKIKKAPQYTSLGLAADLIDEAGNQYTLLEERNYADN